ncbi:glycerol-3-phosphate responsive antiterminator [Virgibacillus halodenitrificans]|jgi:glycerol uptake operon antiterminator|uniref:Glycerol uptake operon antiterminator regulatory protein n=1 Tax=Virgibacillus halodenitrificans TaxID=1482 RepID=A0AAC9J0Y5_VIRHA|nr:glycerol-3-phosphate responsive antiterminator [Virgibacillus halodenitrificans]APC49112.1 glycerol-3-phosphate responsive antiterminator GlpP [Virgibacillus halodenitrificans]MBD1223237.1 glycerol-3-phosphate responsive antiterminator [Virgibacillus halodenitrificans]MCG1026874.1 glycerol-3-phosphate responsive antiterminator [Virgibacillus halodenitrificans]MCJ0932979.1 glycerol-3-phosphate responsive antiterminator [Virgibacillus halodenitrificans]MEC2160503.1 glycerol-3-phosphate respon
MDIPSGIIPAIRKMKDFDKALDTSYDSLVFLETRLAQLKSLVTYTKRANKKALVHFDLIQGLKADEFGMEYLVREVKPDGILSTRANIIKLAKKHNLLSIQRIFLLDSLALDHSLELIKRIQPDSVEVLPGRMPSIIKEIYEQTKVPVIAGGLIKTEEDVSAALKAGAHAVSTSNRELW